jgi:hypothetical protein
LSITLTPKSFVAKQLAGSASITAVSAAKIVLFIVIVLLVGNTV